MLGIVTIDYKNPQMTIDFVCRELPKIDVSYICVIVINGCTEEELNIVQKGTGGIVARKKVDKKSNIYIVPSPDNLGFAKGNNLGVKFLEENFYCDYFLFTNTDIEIKSDVNVSKMIACLDKNERIGAIGPKVISLDGSVQHPHERIISPYRQIGWHLLPFFKRKRTVALNRNLNSDEKQNAKFCYWVQGSFFVIKASVFNKIGLFDPHTFLYAEEQILAEKLKRIGKRMFYYPDVTVLHYEGGTILKENTNYRSLYMAMESNCYYYRKYLHYNPFVVWLYKWTFVLNHKIFK